MSLRADLAPDLAVLLPRKARRFAFAARFLPSPQREATVVLYAFCRVVDDLVDEPSPELDRATILLVAGTVGLAMCHLLGSRRPEALTAAAELGIAMQLTNVLRDLEADLRGGRSYLPTDELLRFGTSPDRLCALAMDGRPGSTRAIGSPRPACTRTLARPGRIGPARSRCAISSPPDRAWLDCSRSRWYRRCRCRWRR